jgi:hypothetical protein
MRTVPKSLLTLSMCLGLSGVVYAQATPTAVKPSTATEATKVKPAAPNVTKDKSAAVSGESATPAVKSPKHEHAARVTPKPAVEKSNKPESPDAKKLESTQVKEAKSNVAKPESATKSNVAKPESATKSNVAKPEPVTKSNVAKPESVKKHPESATKQPEHAAVTPTVHKPMKHEAAKTAEKTEAAKPAQ